MASASKAIVINAPAEQVFNYVADISKHGEWGNSQHKLEVKKTSEGPVGQGSTFTSVGHQFGRNEDTITITEFSPSRHVVYQSDGKAGLMQHTFDIEPADGGVRVTKTFQPLKAKMPFALFAPLAIRMVVPNSIQGDLERIKAHLEGGAS